MGLSVQELDALAKLVAINLNCTTAVISLLDEDFQWFKARVNLESDRPTAKMPSAIIQFRVRAFLSSKMR